MAIAGVLVAAPAANAATSGPARATTVAEQVHTSVTATLDAKTTHAQATHAQASSRSYTVKSGDTLASIAQQFYGNDNDWTWIYQANQGAVHNPNSIYPGEHLTIPANGHQAKHSKHHSTGTPPATTLTTSAVPSGTLSCHGLETLWDDAGGAPGEAVMAASIAMAESGGNQYAHSPTNDYGYWQINGSWGPLATYDALGNAKAAIHISDDGRNWSPWTTYTSGAYYGRC